MHNGESEQTAFPLRAVIYKLDGDERCLAKSEAYLADRDRSLSIIRLAVQQKHLF